MTADISARILKSGAACMLILAFVLAWVATTARLIPIPTVRSAVKDYGSIVRAHIDFLLMALFCLAFAALKTALPTVVCLLVVIGGFTNPSLFVLRGFVPDIGTRPIMRLYRVVSFALSTIGFVCAAVILMRQAI